MRIIRHILALCCSFILYTYAAASTVATAETPGAPDGNEVITFALITDSHVTWSKGKATQALKEVVEDINSRSFDFVVHTGDEANIGSTDQFLLVRDIMNELRAPYYAIPGNHDAVWSESGGMEFAKILGSERFCFKYKGWRFVGCPCGPQVHIVKPALIPRESLQWIKSLPADNHSIFFLHCPLGPEVANSIEYRELVKSKGANVIIGGHTHLNEAFTYKGGLPGIVCRNTESHKKHPGIAYTIIRLGNNTLTFSDCVKGQNGFEEQAPWHSITLHPEDAVKEVDEACLPTAGCTAYTLLEAREGEVWRSLDNANIISGFAVDEETGKAFWGNTAGELKCLDLADGSIKWSFKMKSKIFSTPAFCQNVVVAACSSGEIFGIDASTGKKLWQTRTQAALIASPVIMDGIVYIGSSDKRFRALNLHSGKLVWGNDDVTGFVQNAVAVYPDQLIVADWNRTVYSLDPKSGQLQWKWLEEKRNLMFSAGGSCIARMDGKLYFGTPDNTLHVLDAANGTQLYTMEGMRESLGLSEDGKTLFAKSQNGTLMAVKAESREPIWTVGLYPGKDFCRSPLVCREGLIHIPAFDGSLYFYKERDGSAVDSHKLSDAPMNPIAIVPGRGILVSTMDGFIALLAR